RLHRSPPSSRSELTIRLFNHRARSDCFQNTPKMLWSHLAGINRGELSPPSKGLGFIYAMHSGLMSMLGWHGRGARYGERAVAFARTCDDLWLQGYSSSYSGIGAY